jgi:hypothetical protein
VAGGITAARAVRDEFLAQRGRDERVASNTRLRFGDTADRWLSGPVVDLRPATRQCYRNAVDTHLAPRFANRRLDAVSADDLAKLVRDLRANALAESTIVIVIGVANRIYRYAARRLGWFGPNPVSLMLSSERPKPSQGKRRRLFEGRELEPTLTKADEPFRTLFTLAALTGARLSELLGLTSGNVRSRTSTTPRSSSAGRSTATATGSRPRPTARPGPFRSLSRWLPCSLGIAADPPTWVQRTTCSRPAQCHASAAPRLMTELHHEVVGPERRPCCCSAARSTPT